MKAKVFEIKRFAVHDGDGIRTTVFFKGCPLKCVWCHNPEGISTVSQLAYYANKCISCGECVTICPNGAHLIEDHVHKFERRKCVACGMCEAVCFGKALTFYGKEMSVSELVTLLLEDKEFYESSNGGVTLSGGECLMYADFCAELLKELKKNDIHTAVDTCGFVSKEAIDKVIMHTDIFLYDIKAYTEDTHMKCTGFSNRLIMENLEYIDSKNKKIEIRIPFVNGFNSHEIEKIADFLKKLKNLTKVRVLPYHNYAGTKYKALGMDVTLPDKLPDVEEIQKAKDILKLCALEVI